MKAPARQPYEDAAAKERAEYDAKYGKAAKEAQVGAVSRVPNQGQEEEDQGARRSRRRRRRRQRLVCSDTEPQQHVWHRGGADHGGMWWVQGKRAQGSSVGLRRARVDGISTRAAAGRERRAQRAGGRRPGEPSKAGSVRGTGRHSRERRDGAGQIASSKPAVRQADLGECLGARGRRGALEASREVWALRATARGMRVQSGRSHWRWAVCARERERERE
jgi:hypothetical protein